jgi:hypothetical protein
MTAMRATIVARATRAAAFEARTAAVSAAAIGTPAAITAAWAAAEGPLETRARVAADAGGIARKIFTAFSRTGGTWGAGFAGQEDDVFFDAGGSDDPLAGSGGNGFLFGVDMLGLERLFGTVFFVNFFFVFANLLSFV